MKLQVTQENLSKALNMVTRVASGRNTLPILSNVLIKTVGTRLSVAATNLDIAITTFSGAKVSKEGAITVPARLMQDFISSLPAGVINLTLSDNKLGITAGQYESTINGVPAEEFPVMPAINGPNKWSIPAKTFKEGLNQVVIAASNDEARPILTGVLFQSRGGKLYAAATDSYRLAEKELSSTKQDVSLLVPANAIQDLLRILSDFDGDIAVEHDDQQALFKAGDVELVTRLIEGKYPDYKKLIPTTFSTQATLNTADFVNITKVSSLFARESAGSVTIQVTDGHVSIRSIASQLGENTAAADADTEGDGEITLNSRYLLDALGVLHGEKVTFGFNGKLEPSVLADPKQKDYMHVIMPLKS